MGRAAPHTGASQGTADALDVEHSSGCVGAHGVGARTAELGAVLPKRATDVLAVELPQRGPADGELEITGVGVSVEHCDVPTARGVGDELHRVEVGREPAVDDGAVQYGEDGVG